MNHCFVQQQNTVLAVCEEMRTSVSVSIFERSETVVCPKPRRLGVLNTSLCDQRKPLRWHITRQPELCESGTDLLDILLPKGGCVAKQSSAHVASSPPFFCGSPPGRVSNPLIRDARFVDEKFTPISPRSIPISPSGSSLSPSSSRKGVGCVRASFGNNPAVRIEGFDCLDRDNRRNCSIPALA